ncbi:MAG: hypothetical protein Q9227_001960 [Pyrenula ochraceoflavens]
MDIEKSSYPVAIIGGGPVGLAISILLSLQQIPHVLFERHASTSIHPKSMGLNHRTVEIFRRIGLWDALLYYRAPPETVSRTAWYTSLGPEGRCINVRDSWGGGGYQEEYEQLSHVPYVTISQLRLEPILKARAEELNPHGIRYSCEVKGVREGENVMLDVLDRRAGDTAKVEAEYALVADGGRGMTTDLGFQWEGEQNIVDMVGAHIKAPISLYHPDPSVFLSWFVNPELGGSVLSGYLYHLGPWPDRKGHPELEEWNFACARLPNDPDRFDKKSMLERLHRTLKIPNLEVELLSLSHWYINACTANHYRTPKGRLFLIGDAGHLQPPFGALGLNTGIQDANNLVWKLAMALKSERPEDFDGLLATYESERLPIAQRVASSSLTNMRGHSDIMDRALGISATQTPKENTEAAREFFNVEDLQAGAKKREAVELASRKMDIEFHAIGSEDGWFYNMPAELDDGNQDGIDVRHGGQINAFGEFHTLNYYPSTIPGHHVPHLWLEKDGLRKSTRELLAFEKFTLLPAVFGEDWLRLKSGLVSVEFISSEGCEGQWRDVEGRWEELRGVSSEGAILVRPDGIVAWRTQKATKDLLERFHVLLKQILQLDILPQSLL